MSYFRPGLGDDDADALAWAGRATDSLLSLPGGVTLPTQGIGSMVPNVAGTTIGPPVGGQPPSVPSSGMSPTSKMLLAAGVIGAVYFLFIRKK